jgi:fructokinase
MRIGIDVGGSKLEIIALTDGGQTLLRNRVATPAGDYRGTIEAIARLIESAECRLGARGTVGLGTPGSVSRLSGTIKNSNSTALNGQPLPRDVADRLGREIRIANDANCFAVSEAGDGAAADARTAFGALLGTGVGGGIVVDRTVLGGRDGIAGEWGHNPLPWPRDDERPGPPCYCGKHGCIETFLSGPGMAKLFAQRTGRSASAAEIVQMALGGDAAAIAEWRRYADRLARGLAHACNILDPDAIVLGGGLSNMEAPYDLVPELIPKYIFSDSFDTPIRRALHGDSSGVRGAAWLWG